MDWLPTVITFFLGLASALGLDFGRSQIERRQSRLDRRNDFDRQNLLDLQDAIVRYQKLLVHINVYGYQYWKEHQRVWNSYPLDPESVEYANEIQTTSNGCQVLGSRVNNQDIRDLLNRLLTDGRKFFGAANAEQANTLVVGLNERVESLIDRIGEEIRKI